MSQGSQAKEPSSLRPWGMAGIEHWWSPRWVPVQMGVVALLVSLAHLVFLSRSPFFEHTILDAEYYDAWAKRIAGGQWIGSEAFWVDPLYAYFLGIIYKVAGAGPWLPRLAHACMFGATAGLAAHLAQGLWHSRTAAVISGLLVASCGPLVHYAGQLEKTTLATLLFTAMIVLFMRCARSGFVRDAILAGTVGGATVLARGNALVVVGIGALCLFVGWPEVQKAAGRSSRALATAFLASAIAVVSLAPIHNRLAAGEWSVTTNLGINLFLGNHRDNLHGFYSPPSFVHPDTRTEQAGFRAEALRRSGRELSDAALSAYWRSEAFAEIRSDLSASLLRTISKMQLLIANDEIPDSEDSSLVAAWSPVLRLAWLGWGVLITLAALGAIAGWRDIRARVLGGAIILYLATLLAFFVMGRLRVQVAPLLAVLASGGILRTVTHVASRAYRPFVWALAGATVIAVLSFIKPDWFEKQRRAQLAISWNNLGAILYEANNLSPAAKAFQRAVEIDGPSVPASMRALSEIRLKEDKPLEAERWMRRVVELRPESASARASLSRIYQMALSDPRYQDDAELRKRYREFRRKQPQDAASVFAEVRQLNSAGEHAEAIALLQGQIEVGPYNEDLRYLLGDLMRRYAEPEEMIRYYSRESERDPKPQTSHYFWAVGLARANNIDGAISHVQRAVEIDPAHEMSQLLWSDLLERKGDVPGALEHILEATRIHPDFRDAFNACVRVAERLGRSEQAATCRDKAERANPTSDRRYLHWARALMAHQRHEAAQHEVARMLALHPTDEEALQLQAEIARAAAESGEPAGQVKDIVDQLTGSPPTPAWILYDVRHESAFRLARNLAEAFWRVGWAVYSFRPTPFAVRPGVRLFAANDPGSTSADAVDRALTSLRIDHSYGTGYRAFATEQARTDPNWQGLEFAPDQEFLVVVGNLTLMPTPPQ